MIENAKQFNVEDLVIGRHYILATGTSTNVKVVLSRRVVSADYTIYYTFRNVMKDEDEFVLTVEQVMADISDIPIKATDGIKHDIGKARFELIPMEALMEEMKVLTFGAKKYTPDNWMYVKGRMHRYIGAAGRHLMQWWIGYMSWFLTKDDKYRKRGETPESASMVDFETGISHMAHLACCAHFLTHCELHPGDDEMEGYTDIPEKNPKNPV